MKLANTIFFSVGFITLVGCQNEPDTLFRLIPPSQSNITFSNRITESDTLNILIEEYIYNGGGVGVGDFNNDGLPDLYFTDIKENLRSCFSSLIRTPNSNI